MTINSVGDAGRIQKLRKIYKNQDINIETLIAKEYNYTQVVISELGGVWVTESIGEEASGEMLSKTELAVVADFLEKKLV